VNRRTALMSSAAAVAAVAGVAGALWRSRHEAPSGASTERGETDIWPMAFDNPYGGRLEISALRGKPLLVNFWATWCPPCVSELPLLDRFHREHAAQGWTVVGLAVDNLEPVLQFLAKRPVRFAIGLAGMGGVELSRGLGNSSGALPFSVVFSARGALIQRKLGVITTEDLTSWAASVG
jgi:thiol-disulfide isomerase/thioredoxin